MASLRHGPRPEILHEPPSCRRRQAREFSAAVAVVVAVAVAVAVVDQPVCDGKTLRGSIETTASAGPPFMAQATSTR